MMTQRSSEILNNLKCILCIFIVMIHSQISPESWSQIRGGQHADYQVFIIFEKIFTDIFLDHSCVPVFFCISGYLFFLKYKETFSTQDYKLQIKKRCRGLFVPFIIANVVYYLTFALLPAVRHNMLSNIGLIDFLQSFWSYKGTNIPINGPLWYLRDLMVLACLSPIIYYLIKKTKVAFILILIALWMLNLWVAIPGFGCYPYVFFSLGALFAVRGQDLVESMTTRLHSIIGLIIYPIMICVITYIGYNEGDMSDAYIACLKIGQLLSIPFWFVIASQSVRLHVFSRGMATATFFVFLYHYSLVFPGRIINYLNLQLTNMNLFTSYIIGVAIETAVLLCIYYILKRYIPKVASIIVGGR